MCNIQDESRTGTYLADINGVSATDASSHSIITEKSVFKKRCSLWKSSFRPPGN